MLSKAQKTRSETFSTILKTSHRNRNSSDRFASLARRLADCGAGGPVAEVKNPQPFKPGFRPTLLTILSGLILMSVALVGLTSYYHARRTANGLANQILEQTSQRIEERVLVLLRHAAEQGALANRRIRDEIISARSQPTAAQFPSITAYLHEVMQVDEQLSFLSLGLEASGEYCHVERRPGGKLSIQQCVRGDGGRIERSDFEVRPDGTRTRARFDADWHYDPRTRPYYQACRAAGKQTWTETYVFRNDPSPDVPGVTCATPVKTPAGELVGVISSDFNLEAICGFLQTMHIGQKGFAVVI